MTRYISTRGRAPTLEFADVLLTGLAADGGLYVPESWPGATPKAVSGQPYAEFAVEVMWPYVAGWLDRDEFAAIVADAYRRFADEAVVPFSSLGDRLMLADLYWGPTLAFKDIAMQLLGRLFDTELARRDERSTILGATSGDTGSAAIEAFRGRANVDIVILHPRGRTTEVQRRQMTTVTDGNVHNIAIEGTFDDCQDIVKALFSDQDFRAEQSLGAVNSINWARVMAQIVYYHWAASHRPPDADSIEVIVPTGNFGNVFAGRAAVRTGAAISRLVVASNRNDILTQFFEDGAMAIAEVTPTLSPSMDIQVSSNLERLIFELLDENGEAVEDLLSRFREAGSIELPEPVRDRLGGLWAGVRVDDDATLATMRRVHDEHGLLIDPHTAVGVAAAREMATGDRIQVVMATAHPAKFPDAVERATGIRPDLPGPLADLFERPERYETLPADVEAIREYVGTAVGSG